MQSLFPQTCSPETNALLAFLDTLPCGLASYAIGRQNAEANNTLSAFEAAVNAAVATVATRLEAVDRLHRHGRRAIESHILKRLEAGADADELSAAIRCAITPRSPLQSITIEPHEGAASLEGARTYASWQDARQALSRLCDTCDRDQVGVEKSHVHVTWLNGMTRSISFGIAHRDNPCHQVPDPEHLLTNELAFCLGLRCPTRWTRFQYDSFRAGQEPAARALIDACDIPGLVTVLIDLVPIR